MCAAAEKTEVCEDNCSDSVIINAVDMLSDENNDNLVAIYETKTSEPDVCGVDKTVLHYLRKLIMAVHEEQHNYPQDIKATTCLLLRKKKRL